MTPGRINQIAAFFSKPSSSCSGFWGLAPRPSATPDRPRARSARGLSFGFAERVCSSRLLASRPTSTRPSCARLQARCCFQDLPRANTSRFAILSTPLALLARRTPSRPLSLLEKPAGPRQQQPSCSGCPSSFLPRGNRRGACLLASSANGYGTRTSANLSPFQALSVFNRRAC